MSNGRDAALAAVLALLLPGVALAQQPEAQPPATPAAPETVAPQPQPDAIASPQDQGQSSTPQPTAKTPPTNLPKKAPDTAVTGVTGNNVRATTEFGKGQVPGQPLPSDPTTIRTLQDALSVALGRSPGIQIAQEHAVQTTAQVNQITALERPQISASGTYSRLANASSAGVSGGVSPAAISNPFGVGLSITPPGSTPVQLSTTSGTSGGVGAANATASSTTTTSTSAASSTLSSANSNVTSSSTTGRAVAQRTDSGNLPSFDEGTSTFLSNPDAVTRTVETETRATSGSGSGSGSSNIASAFTANLNQESAHVSVTQLVDITGIVRTAVQVGDMEKALSRLELARTRQQTALQVTSAYYSVLRALAFVRVNEAAVADDTELLRVTKAQLTAGVAAQFDVLRAQTQLDNDTQALISSRNQVAIAKNNLANTIGLDPSTLVEPQTVSVPPLPTLDEETLIQTAYKQRPEYLEADINLMVAQKNIRLAHRNMEPYLNVAASGNYNPVATVFSKKATAAVGVTLNIPLYDGGATRAAVDQAHSLERSARIQKDQFDRGIKAEVQQAIIAVRDADERGRSIAATVAEAREALRLANVRYRAGVGTQLDVYNAESTLVQAESNQVNATYDYLGALASLSRAVGNPV